MAGKNLVDGVLLLRIQLKLAGEPVQQRVSVVPDGFMPLVLLPFVHDTGAHTSDEHGHDQERASHGRRGSHRLFLRASSNSCPTLGRWCSVARARPTAPECRSE